MTVLHQLARASVATRLCHYLAAALNCLTFRFCDRGGAAGKRDLTDDEVDMEFLLRKRQVCT